MIWFLVRVWARRLPGSHRSSGLVNGLETGGYRVSCVEVPYTYEWRLALVWGVRQTHGGDVEARNRV